MPGQIRNIKMEMFRVYWWKILILVRVEIHQNMHSIVLDNK
jgi:hypothetical protein